MDSADTLRDNLLKNLATALTPFHGGPVTIEVLHREESGYWAAHIHYPDRTMQLTGKSESVVLGYLCGSIMRDLTRPEVLAITKELHYPQVVPGGDPLVCFLVCNPRKSQLGFIL